MEQKDNQVSKPEDRTQDLLALRDHIDSLDQELLILLNHRAQASLDAALLKAELGLPRFDQQREEGLIADLAAANPGPLTGDDIQAIYQLLLRRFRGLPLDLTRASLSGKQGQEVG